MRTMEKLKHYMYLKEFEIYSRSIDSKSSEYIIKLRGTSYYMGIYNDTEINEILNEQYDKLYKEINSGYREKNFFSNISYQGKVIEYDISVYKFPSCKTIEVFIENSCYEFYYNDCLITTIEEIRRKVDNYVERLMYSNTLLYFLSRNELEEGGKEELQKLLDEQEVIEKALSKIQKSIKQIIRENI